MTKNNKKPSAFKSFLKARNTKRGAVSIAITVLIAVAVILLNVAVRGLTSRYSLYADTTSNGAFRLQDVTAQYAASIEKDVDFYVLTNETTFEDTDTYFAQANKLIRQLCECSSHITLHYIDLTSTPEFPPKYPEVDWKSSHLCLVACGDRYRVIDAEDMFDYELDSSTYTYKITDQHIEQAIASALLTVTSDRLTTVAVLTGQAEEDLSAFTARLSNNAYQVVTVDLSTGSIPAEAEFLIIYAPAVDIDEDMFTAISDWLTNGGNYGHNVLYVPSDLRDVSEFPNLNALMADYGMSLDYGYIREDDLSYISAAFSTPLCSRYVYADTTFTEKLQNSGIPVYLYCTLPVNILDSSAAKPMLTTSESAFFGPITISGNFDPDYRSFCGAAIGTRSNGSTDRPLSSHVVVIGSHRSFWEEFLNYKAFNNAAYFVNIFNTLSSAENIGVVIEGKDLSAAVLGADSAASVNFIGILARYVIPLGVLIAGLIIWLIRRHR